MRRSVRAAVWGITLMAVVSLYVSYARLIRSVEFAATTAGIVDIPKLG
jgi:hypothetical protein